MRRQRVLGAADSRAPAQRRVHGLTPAERGALVARQGGRCALCLRDGLRLQVDHDHRHCPGREGCQLCIRGMLCGACNMHLGKLESRGSRDRLVIYLGATP